MSDPGHKRMSTPSLCRRGLRAFDREAFRKPHDRTGSPHRESWLDYLMISAIARRDIVIGQYLIDANIRPMLLPRVVSRNATRARHNLRVMK